MLTITTILELQKVMKAWRLDCASIAFVPTMGNLHDGHLHLIEVAKSKAEKVVASIFVNPSQFGPGEDYDSYPRTELVDQQKLEAVGTDLLFMPTVMEMYPDKIQTIISVPSISGLHCGAFRPGHFDGVATVVCKLFNIVQPNIAVFGRKDFQQYTVIKTMVKDLNLPIEIIGVDTVRSDDGLALSSRNGYLNPQQRLLASNLHLSLCMARETVLTKKLPYSEIEADSMRFLQKNGFEVEYFSICRVDDLKKATLTDAELVILTAARLGKTRLIDNLCVTLS